MRARKSPRGLSWRTLTSLKEMRQMPTMATRKPQKKFPCSLSLKTIAEASPVKKGAVQMMTPTLEA